MKHLVSALAILLAAACGSKSTGPGGAGGGTEFTGPLEAGQWETLDDPTRARFMKQVVLPEMAALFQGFDAEEFSGFDCKTCHGSGVDIGNFHMPNEELPVLTMEKIQSPDDDHKAVTEFMAMQVKPTMARLLGIPEWTPETPDGFGCTGCHTMEQ